MSTYKKINTLLTPDERKKLPGLLFLVLIGMFLEMLGIGLIIPVLGLMSDDNLIQNHPVLLPFVSYLGQPSPARLVAYGMMILFGLYVFKAIFMVFMSWEQNKFIYGLQASLSSRLYAGYLQQPWSFHLQRNSAQLINNVTTEVNVLTYAVQSAIVLLTEGFVLVGIIVLLFAIEPLGAPIIIGIVGLAAWVFQRCSQNYVSRQGAARQYHDGMRIQHLQQGLGGAKEVKLLGRELDFITEYNFHNEGSAYASRILTTLSTLPRLWLELLAVGGLAILVLILLTQGTNLHASVPILGFFAAAAFRIIPSVNRILAALQTLRADQPVVNRLNDEMQIARHTTSTRHNANLPFQQELRLENIDYRYINAERPALINISLSIPRGTCAGFTGTSGAGKSTLIDVTLGLLAPEKGHVLVDGVDIQSNLRGWQNQIGYVPQSIFLTDDTLRRNVAFGMANNLIDDEAVLRAIKAAQLEEFVNSLPQGMETLVGERGVRLSGGQRQRIGIARALYHNPGVLILDEATSALDLATEKGVMESIYALHGDKTILIVAHRLSTVANCNKVYKLENGRIVEIETLKT